MTDFRLKVFHLFQIANAVSEDLVGAVIYLLYFYRSMIL